MYQVLKRNGKVIDFELDKLLAAILPFVPNARIRGK